jgi:hypothetical protein
MKSSIEPTSMMSARGQATMSNDVGDLFSR